METSRRDGSDEHLHGCICALEVAASGAGLSSLNQIGLCRFRRRDWPSTCSIFGYTMTLYCMMRLDGAGSSVPPQAQATPWMVRAFVSSRLKLNMHRPFHTHGHTHAYIHAYTKVYMLGYTYTYTHVYIHVCTQACAHAYPQFLHTYPHRRPLTSSETCRSSSPPPMRRKPSCAWSVHVKTHV